MGSKGLLVRLRSDGDPSTNQRMATGGGGKESGDERKDGGKMEANEGRETGQVMQRGNSKRR